MKKAIYKSIVSVSILSILLFGVLAVAIAYYEQMQNVWGALREKAFYIASAIESDDENDDLMEKIHAYEGRLTIVAPDGTVLYDDKYRPADMENHADREEIGEALANGTGEATRTSETLGMRYIYYALRLSDGNVLRVSDEVDGIWRSAAHFIPWLLLTAVGVALLAALAASRLTKRIVNPVNALNLDDPLSGQAYPELSPLLRRVDAQNAKIREQLEELDRRQTEFSAITDSIAEGLIIVDGDGNVVTLNESARDILDVRAGDVAGKHILSVVRNLELNDAVRTAASGTAAETVLTLSGRAFRLTASPAVAGENVRGAVLLLVDETEKDAAEKSRREFSANVSHELKTPLTSILGYAEIIRDGVAKDGDVPAFAGRIYNETRRMIELVEDIIRLSKLDEKSTEVTKENVDLLEIANEVVRDLSVRAGEKGVQLAAGGCPAQVFAARGILYEVVYNLADNAVRYNRAGGTAMLTVAADGEEAKLSVQDTGPGIAPEHRERIFERFYRVDKSHSRESGGTGLGLSIAKRGASFNGGAVALECSDETGSRFVLTLPLAPEAR